MQAVAHGLDSLDRMAAGTALGIFVGSLATTPGSEPLPERVATAAALAALAYGVVWLLQR